MVDYGTKGHFTHETEGPWLLPFQALSLVENAEPVQVRFTLPLRDQRSMWMQDGCKVHMNFYIALNGSCFMVTWTLFKTHLLGVGFNTKLGDHGTRRSHNHWYYYILACVRTPYEQKFFEIAYGWGTRHMWLHTTLDDPWPHCMILELSWDGLWTRHLRSNNSMVTALGLHVKWPK